MLASADGGSVTAVAADLGVSRDTVRKWRSRSMVSRLEGLPDEPRPGAPRTIMAGVAVNVGFHGLWRSLSLFGAAPAWLTDLILVLAGMTALLGIAHAAVQQSLQRVPANNPASDDARAGRQAAPVRTAGRLPGVHADRAHRADRHRGRTGLTGGHRPLQANPARSRQPV